MRLNAMPFRSALTALFGLVVVTVFADDAKDYVPKLGEFPPPNSGQYFAGELVAVDHVNRRGALRLIGDGDDGRYHAAPSLRFALLPYGALRYHGAPAELRDIPIGTLLHGYFVVAPAGDKSVPPPDKEALKYLPKYTHALTLEDDFSFYQRQGKSWRVVSVDAALGKFKVSSTGPAATDGLKGEKTFEIDASTRVWTGRQIANLQALAPEQIVQLNLTWAPDWKNGQFHCADIWLDQESRDLATEVQRQIHIHHERSRWLAGWVDDVEHQEGGKGIVSVTLFGGMDPMLYDQVKSAKAGVIAASDKTLRTWWQDHDCKHGPVLDYKETPNPPPGSSGLQLRLQINELLEGFRPGRIVRFRPNGWPNVKLPPEERINSLSDL